MAKVDSTLLDKAIVFATKAHHNVERRGKDFPYIVHPLEVVSIVASLTSDQDLLAAAALHDTVEDTDVTIEDIKKEFNDRVAKIVEDESDKYDPSLSMEQSWKERKIAAVNRLKNAPIESKMVALGDKLSNMRQIYRDYMTIGDEIWNVFHVKDKREHEWHYRELANALSDLKDTFAYKELVELIDRVFPSKR